MQKAEIVKVGTVRDGFAEDWHFRSADVGVSHVSQVFNDSLYLGDEGILCGYTLDELRQIAES